MFSIRGTAILLGSLAILLGVAIAFDSWLGAHDARLRLDATIAAQQKTIFDADAREHARSQVLQQELDQIAKLKRDTQTPEAILAALPRYLPLPKPLVMKSGGKGSASPLTTLGAPPSGTTSGDVSPSPNRSPGSTATASGDAAERTSASKIEARLSPNKDSQKPNPPADESVLLPAEDLKPLLDFSTDCRACRLELATAQANQADEHSKTLAVAAERDAAIRAARGGGFWTKARRAAKWFVIGATVGAAAAYASR